jgi:hypothetical protein
LKKVFENRAVNLKKWKNIVLPERPLMIIWRRHVVFEITAVTNTLPEYVILRLLLFHCSMVAQTHLNVT